jgi:hypothetical protein
MSIIRRGMAVLGAGLAMALGSGAAMAQQPATVQVTPSVSKKRKKQLFTGKVIYEGGRYHKTFKGSVARDKRLARKLRNKRK